MNGLGLVESLAAGSSPAPYCSLWVPGVPRPGGSKSAFPLVREVGRLPQKAEIATLFAFRSYMRQQVKLAVTMSESGKHTAEWRKAIARVAKGLGLVPPADEPEARYLYRADWEFHMPRPQAHYRTKGGKPSTVLHDWAVGLRPGSMPDALKLIRAAEDALTGIVWHDDAAVVLGRFAKVYAGEMFGSGMSVTIWRGDEYGRGLP